MSTPLVLRVLGPLRADLASRAVDLGGPRQRAVLARLAVSRGHVVSTDRLVDDLWDGEPPPRALAALQVHVSHLRRALEPDRPRRAPAAVLVSTAPGYALHLPDDAVDAWRFEGLLAEASAVSPGGRGLENRRAALDRALACWSGPAYAEVADTAWAAPEVVRLDALRLGALEQRAETDLALGRTTQAVADLERHLHEHPGREEAVRLLTLGLYREGRQGDPLAVLRRARAHLAAELGVDPGPRLRAMEADVLAQAPGLDWSPPSDPSPPAAAATAERAGDVGPSPARAGTVHAPTASGEEAGGAPAVGSAPPGRAAELAAVLAAGEEASASRSPRVVWLAGEAGEGKSTVLTAAASALARGGWTVAWGRCPEVEGAPPGWAFTEVLEDLGEDGLEALTAGTAGEPSSSPPSPFLLARDVAARLAARADRTPLAVALDDVHRADGLTLQLLRQAVDHLGEAPVLLLGAYRASEAGTELASVRAALAGVTSAHLRLAGLDRAAVEVVAHASGLGAVDATTVDLLTERTGGNPLFVRELARLLAAGGEGVARTAVPQGVADVLRLRLARLPAPAVTALRQAAVLGRQADVDVLAAMAGRDPDELLDALEPSVLAGLLEEPAPGTVRFAHTLVRDTLYEDTPMLRRTRLHAGALAVLERRSPGDAAALAHHALAGLTPATAAGALRHVRAAAEAATTLAAPGEAARLYRAALRVLAVRGDADAAEGVLLRSRAVTALAQAGDAVTARRLQREAVRLAGDDTGLLRTALTAWDAPLIWSVRALREADEEVVGALRRLLAGVLPEPVRARLLCALFLELEGWRTEEALDCSREALDLARRSSGGDARLLCAALNARAYAALGPDLAAEREEVAAELVAVAAAAGQTDYQAVGQWLLFLAAAARADLPRAQEAVDAAVELCGTGQLTQLLGVLDIWGAVLGCWPGTWTSGSSATR